MLSNKVYDVLKWIIISFVPAFIALLTSLTMVWGWDIPLEAIVATISAITAFLGTLLGISSVKYNKEEK